MSQIAQIVSVVKQQLKAASKTYADVAIQLGISEASVKRLFSQQDLTLERLQKICQMMGLELLDIMRLARQQRPAVQQLTLAQEQSIINDETLMLVLICVLSHWTLDNIVAYYTLSKADCISKLIALNTLGIIELLPNNHIRLRIASNFDWLPDGPIYAFFKRHMQHDFMHCQFDQSNELFVCKSGMLTEEANRLLQREMRKLADKFLALSNEDIARPLAERDGSAIMIALRPWVPDIFNKLKR
ncbi:MAG: transcriptional regulator [Coxiella sp. (in: Bacteria)]|nr:MAG: transcriptional regulator [Coxiella sp. (in: g-proteobacteria)]